MKIIVSIMLTMLFVSQNAFASGYGGYDQEPIEVSYVDISLTGDLKSTCEESRESIMSKVSIDNCEDKYEHSDSCECVEVDGDNFCEYKATVSCQPYYEYY